MVMAVVMVMLMAMMAMVKMMVMGGCYSLEVSCKGTSCDSVVQPKNK